MRSRLVEFKATLKNANYEKLVEDSALFAATKKTVAAALSMMAPGCHVDVELSPGSVKIDASVLIPPERSMDFSVVVSNLSKTSIGSELLQSVAEQPGFDGLKEDPLQNFTVSDVSVAVNPDRQVAVRVDQSALRTRLNK